MTAFRDAHLGRMDFPTVFAELKETLGDGLEVAGRAVAPGDPRPRPFELKLPIHGHHEDVDPAELAERLRRQVRATLEALSHPLYFRFDQDDDLNGWLHIGGGDVEYAEGGPTLSDYAVSLSDCFRRATLRTHRPARRLEAKDRRLSTVARDYKRKFFSGTEFAASTALSELVLPVGVTDVVSSSGAVLAPTARATTDGNLGVVTGRAHLDVLSYEQAEADFQKADVLALDRRGIDFGAGGGGTDGPNNPASGTDDAGVGSVAWTAPGNILANDGAYATCAIGNGVISHYLKATNFGFAIPADATILGIKAELHRYHGSGNLFDYRARIVKGGAIGSTDLSSGESIPTAAAYKTFGGSSSLWGTTWTAADINASDFGFAYAFTRNGSGSLPLSAGHVRITVYFSAEGEAAQSLEGDIDPQGEYGWEELYGPEQNVTAGVVPTLQNGLCRVGWVEAFNAFTLDGYMAGIGYVEQARFGLYRDNPAGTETQYTSLLSARLVEYVPYERAVVRAVLGIGATDRCEVFITLQRGWTGPRVEAYASWTSAGVPGVAVRVQPFTSGATTRGRSNANGTVVDGTDYGSWSGLQPWGYMLAASVDLAVHMAVLQTTPKLVGRTGTALYGTSRIGVSVAQRVGSALAGYVSVRFGLGPRASAAADATTLGQVHLWDARSVPCLVSRG